MWDSPSLFCLGEGGGELIFALKWRKIAPLHDSISLPSWSISMRVVIYYLLLFLLGGGVGGIVARLHNSLVNASSHTGYADIWSRLSDSTRIQALAVRGKTGAV